MNYKRLIKKSFSGVVPLTDNESFRKSITERTVQMENKKRFTFKKPAIAVCAVIAALSLGITAAAATGILNFNEIFGNRIRTENEELDESLIGNAENVKWTTSDEDYIVNLKGVTGTDESVIAVIEIARADGEPAEDYFRNTDLLAETNLMGVFSDCRIDGEYPGVGRGDDEYVNAKGNIEISVEFSGLHHSYNMSGRRISLSGTGFYPAYNLIEGDVPREKTAFMAYGDSEYQLTQEEWDYLDSIAVLDLDWSVEFVYNPSEKSADKLVAKDLSGKSLLSVDIDIKHENSDGTISFENFEVRELEAAFDEITISSVGGKFSGSIDVAEWLAKSYYPRIVSRSDIEVKLINRDGTESDIMVWVTSGTSNMNAETGNLDFCFELEFHANGGQTAIDLSEIGAISINGTIYELN